MDCYLVGLLLLTERDLPESENVCFGRRDFKIWRQGVKHELELMKCERLKLLLMMFWSLLVWLQEGWTCYGGTMWSSVSWLPTMGAVYFSAWCCWSLCACSSMHYFWSTLGCGIINCSRFLLNCFLPLIWHIEICISSSADICLVFILPFMTFLIWATVCTSTEKKEIYM